MSLIFFITATMSKLVSTTINPENSKSEIIGYLSPQINNVNHNSAFAFISLNLEVEIKRLKSFV